jgi:hypothetical protein
MYGTPALSRATVSDIFMKLRFHGRMKSAIVCKGIVSLAGLADQPFALR